MNKLNLLVLGSLIGFTTPMAMAATSPSEVNIKLYQLWIGATADCLNMTQVYNETNPSYQNMVNGPTFGTMTIPNGTYNCVAFRMSDYLQFRPIASTGSCTASQLYTRDLFRAETPAITSTCPDSTNITGTGSLASPVEDQMCIYMSVTGNLSGGAYTPSDPMLLNNPFVVSGTQTGTMVTDFTNKIDGSQPDCDCNPPDWDFR